jgi:hypothetical protein
MQLSFGSRRLRAFAMASALLVLYVNGPIVAYADDSQVPVDQCGSGQSYDACQPQADPAQTAPVVDQNQNVDQINQPNVYQSGQNDTVYG